MQFPNTWEEFEQAYGFEDKKEIYTNGSRLIQSFRVKQWLDHIAEPERKAPISYEEQLSLDCSFCRQHECGDTLYESSDWDGGIGFDYIRDIQFCPICGRKLYGNE